ncbi:hypothetical protein [Flavobacterium denitrificans]|uniref:hypothetical protein n=1 Tax=Flavobacterium denitrificans TaxID=281361 RepID=UPI000402592D|nr:hypothetical protein [Flavobacterium denitrificans]
MEKYTIEHQYQLYLKRVGLSEETMHEDQRIQLRQTFFGAFGQFILFLETDIANMEENNAVEVLESFKTEVANYYLSITQN